MFVEETIFMPLTLIADYMTNSQSFVGFQSGAAGQQTLEPCNHDEDEHHHHHHHHHPFQSFFFLKFLTKIAVSNAKKLQQTFLDWK